jgi:hypothetical protein
MFLGVQTQGGDARLSLTLYLSFSREICLDYFSYLGNRATGTDARMIFQGGKDDYQSQHECYLCEPNPEVQ